jgi:hypothetical protein
VCFSLIFIRSGFYTLHHLACHLPPIASFIVQRETQKARFLAAITEQSVPSTRSSNPEGNGCPTKSACFADICLFLAMSAQQNEQGVTNEQQQHRCSRYFHF